MPVEQATTRSLEALQAYGLGQKTMVAKGGLFECSSTLSKGHSRSTTFESLTI